jgi:hypothetical protein
MTADIQASIDGGTLQVSAPRGVQPGTATRLTFDVTFKEFTVPGYVDVKVVSSTKAPPQAVDDGPIYLTRGASATVPVLANDFNPFPGEPLTVIAAEVDQLDVGSNASVSFTTKDVTVRAGAAFTGTLSVIYRIQDATKDPARETQGRVTVIVRDRPDQPNAPYVEAGDAYADIRWQAPAPNNSPITSYEVSYGNDTATFGAGAAGITQRITGLTNGTAYTFRVRAVNDIGASEWSAGTTDTPYGTPTVPRNVTLQSSGDAPADLTATWDAPSSTGGGAVTYEWRIVGTGNGWTSTTGTTGRVNNVGAGTYTLEVHATNNGSQQTGPTGSDTVGVSNPPKTVTLSKGARTGYIAPGPNGSCESGNCWFYNVSVSGFPDGTASGYAYCNGGQLSTNIRISVSGGRGSYTGKYPDSWCGYSDAYVIIDGVRSNNW